jgi:Zn-dependent peptidase ImmA (M78 family)
MFALAEEEGIEILWFDFNPPIRGLYWAPKKFPPVIGLDNKLDTNTPLLRCIMAEELGHHFTLDRDCLCRTYFNYRDRLAISKAEYRAFRWAAIYLMPKARLVQAFHLGYVEAWRLADRFNVTEDMVRFRLRLPDINNEKVIV